MFAMLLIADNANSVLFSKRIHLKCILLLNNVHKTYSIPQLNPKIQTTRLIHFMRFRSLVGPLYSTSTLKFFSQPGTNLSIFYS